jgi:hypothetical protein
MSRKSGEEYLSIIESLVVASGQSAAIVAFFTAYSALLKRMNPKTRGIPRAEAQGGHHPRRNDISKPL